MNAMSMGITAAITPGAVPPHSGAVRPHLDSGRMRDIVLVRIATGGKALLRADLVRDLTPMVAHVVTAAEWAALLDRDLGALADAGLCEVKALTVAVTAAGSKRAALMLGLATMPRSWPEAKGVRLVAKALGIEAQPARRLRTLLKADGLRAAIVQQAFSLNIRGLPTPARLRAQLASLALSRAFGNTLPPDTDARGGARSGLPAKAGRGLAGRLAHPPRDFPTDSRLIAVLAMEHAGAVRSDFASLQTAVLRRHVTRGPVAQATSFPTPTRRTGGARKASTTAVSATTAAPVAITQGVVAPDSDTVSAIARASIRPDFESFVVSVRCAALAHADGWPGNRKAFVSRVWTALQSTHPEWAVNGIEFKAMLAEAHRLGHIVLANADLKDQRSIGDIQASAIAYRNSMFHYVRVDD